MVRSPHLILLALRNEGTLEGSIRLSLTCKGTLERLTPSPEKPRLSTFVSLAVDCQLSTVNWGYLLSFDILPHSLRTPQNLSLVFSINSTLLPQNTRDGWAQPVSASRPKRANSRRATGGLLTRHSPLPPRISHFCSVAALSCTFLHSPKHQLPSLQPLPSSLRKTPGVYPLAANSERRVAAKPPNPYLLTSLP
jgi:hypothetical protein